MESLQAQILKHNALSVTDIQAMCALYLQYYEADPATVIEDLLEKDYVILLRDAEGEIQGFTTILLLDFNYQNTNRMSLFSGDTVIHQSHWGTQALSLSWCQFAGEIKARRPDTPLYWFLIVKGYRTYRYLPLFSKVFYPNHRYQTPESIQSMVDYLAKRRFGDAYSESRGIVSFKESRGRLRDSWAEIPTHVQKNPDVQYFLNRNPDFKSGDELVCFTELSTENLRSYALRAFRRSAQ